MRQASECVLLAVIGQLLSCAHPVAVKGASVPRPHELPTGVECLDWPLGPSYRNVSFGFHDPSYAFKAKVGEHDAIDLPAPVGTEIYAPASGKVFEVVPVVDADRAARISVRIGIHWTYRVGHLSRVDVEKGAYVRRGAQLGLSGGEPGTPGSGSWTTGPHLHFNLQYDGKPVDPLPYMCP